MGPTKRTGLVPPRRRHLHCVLRRRQRRPGTPSPSFSTPSHFFLFALGLPTYPSSPDPIPEPHTHHSHCHILTTSFEQCVLGTIVDSYFRGYDCVVLRDCVATTSPTGAYENVIYNSTNVRLFFFRIFTFYLLLYHSSVPCPSGLATLSELMSSQSYGFVTDSARVVEAAEAYAGATDDAEEDTDA